MTPRTGRYLPNCPLPSIITPLTLHVYFCVQAPSLNQPDSCACGTYTIEDLRARAAMLEMLAAAIDLMHDELEVLVREIFGREGQKK
ncbi:MAG: hypothetical protein E6K58_13715 [Nitrospirae bacterium]|nr:MAG: hypothetical protein E6K58_13715 [Nitrospirota bacterium]